jgi:hypothetical protein
MNSRDDFTVGRHRPVYLWAGPGTIRMNRLKFLNAPVDEAVHLEAHTPTGVARVADEAGFNWAYLTYDWGFPPEVEEADWEAFRQAVPVYQAAGVRVFGYVQTSNCAYTGSYRTKDWYAVDIQGHRFPYYTGRLMTCWLHPEWLEHLKEMTAGVIAAGADGVFFDNPWWGAQPFHVGGVWLGGAGCACPRCRQAFQAATGLDFPTRLDPTGDLTSRRYLRWRAMQVTATLQQLADYARTLNPAIAISANDYDVVMRPSFIAHGIDLAGLAGVQDVLMIEDFALPRWEPASGAKGNAPLLVNNALTLRTARALAGGTPVTTDPYDKGIGFDDVYPARRFQQGIAEAAACGMPMVVKGTEFVDERGTFTLLTAGRYAEQRAAMGRYHRWLAEYAALYRDRENAATVALLYPGEALWQAWDRVAPLYFGVAQTLLAAGIPWRVVLPEDELSGLKVLFCFENILPPGTDGALPEARSGRWSTITGRLVNVPDLPGWAPPPPGRLARHPALQPLAGTLLRLLLRAYFESPWVRRWTDRRGVAQRFYTAAPSFALPPAAAQATLLAQVGERAHPHVTAETPVLVEHWRQGEKHQLHLVNYAAEPQTVMVDFGRPVTGRALSPDRPPVQFLGLTFDGPVEVYTVLEYSDYK